MKKYTGKVNPKEEQKLDEAQNKVQEILNTLNKKTPKGNIESAKRLQMILESVEGDLYVLLFLFLFLFL